MMNINLVVTVAIALTANRFLNTKADLSVVSYDIECPKADPEYFKDIEVYIEDEGKDNEFFINFTLLRHIPLDTTITLKMIGASMGEFVVATGIEFTVNVCDAIKEPIFGRHMFRQMGINTVECYCPPGIYGGSHINLVDLSSVPDNFLPNRYKMVVFGQIQDHLLFECWTFFRIQ